MGKPFKLTMSQHLASVFTVTDLGGSGPDIDILYLYCSSFLFPFQEFTATVVRYWEEACMASARGIVGNNIVYLLWKLHCREA